MLLEAACSLVYNVTVIQNNIKTIHMKITEISNLFLSLEYYIAANLAFKLIQNCLYLSVIF
jgi:hypothetical protein